MIRFIGTLHIIESSLDVLKRIRNLKLIDFRDLCILLKSNTIPAQISGATVEKAIQINNYFLLNKIYLTRYDLESLDEMKRENAQLKLRTNDAIRLKSPKQRMLSQEDKSTEMTLDRIVLKRDEPLRSEQKQEKQEQQELKSRKQSLKPLKKSAEMKLQKSDTFYTIQTYDTFLHTPTPPNLLSDRTYLDRAVNILETPPSLLELLYLEQIRKKNMVTKF